MSAEHDALVRAILAEPDDDTRRLVYADWLDEFATTDQQRARSEWIRLACRGGKRSTKPTRLRERMPGERDWLVANAHRLWPRLHSLSRKKVYDRVRLPTGKIDLRFALEVVVGRGPGGRYTLTDYRVSVVRLVASRGVVAECQTTSNRAALVAPAFAADEPLADVTLRSGMTWAYHWRDNDNLLLVSRDHFDRAGLGGVWDLLGGETVRVQPEGYVAKVWLTDGRGRGLFGMEADRRVEAALTRWARAEAVRREWPFAFPRPPGTDPADRDPESTEAT